MNEPHGKSWDEVMRMDPWVICNTIFYPRDEKTGWPIIPGEKDAETPTPKQRWRELMAKHGLPSWVLEDLWVKVQAIAKKRMKEADDKRQAKRDRTKRK